LLLDVSINEHETGLPLDTVRKYRFLADFNPEKIV